MIVLQIPEYLQEAASVPAYHLYLMNKFNWGPTIPQSIEWRVIEFVMHKLNSTNQTRICKIIHEWTPTWVSPGNYPSHKHDKLCPSCLLTHETPEHLLQCDTPEQQKIWQQFYLTFLKLYIKYAIDPHLSQMWWSGMITNNSANHTVNLYPEEYQLIFLSQQLIGWKQIYYGWISKQLTHHITMHQPNLDPINLHLINLSCLDICTQTMVSMQPRPSHHYQSFPSQHAHRSTTHFCSLRPSPTTHSWLHLQPHWGRITPKTKTLDPKLDPKQPKLHLQQIKNSRQTNQNWNSWHLSVFPAPLTIQCPKQCGSSLLSQVNMWSNN